MEEKVIEIKSLGVNYGEKEVLKNIDLNVYKGTIIGYIGPNGAGKSTTIKILLGLNRNYSGEVKIFGQDIKNQNYNFKKNVKIVENLKTKLGVILFSERRSKTARTSVVNELNSKILLILFLIYMIIFLADILRESDL